MPHLARRGLERASAPRCASERRAVLLALLLGASAAAVAAAAPPSSPRPAAAAAAPPAAEDAAAFLRARGAWPALLRRLAAAERRDRGGVAAACAPALLGEPAAAAAAVAPFDPCALLALAHTPKAAGTTLQGALRARLPRYRWTSAELCYAQVCRAPPAVNLAAVRSPRAHALSQFTMCRDSRWGRGRTRGTRFAPGGSRREGFTLWVEHFASLRGNGTTPRGGVDKEVAFGCYDPRDMQSRVLGCGARAGSGAPAKQFFGGGGEADRSQAEALRAAHTAGWVGVVDALKESVCLLDYRLSGDGSLPERCRCGGGSAELGSRLAHVAHGVGAHRVAKQSAAALAHTDALVARDAGLFRSALLRTLCELRAVERAANASVVCEGAAAKLGREVEYLLEGTDDPGAEALLAPGYLAPLDLDALGELPRCATDPPWIDAEAARARLALAREGARPGGCDVGSVGHAQAALKTARYPVAWRRRRF